MPLNTNQPEAVNEKLLTAAKQVRDELDALYDGAPDSPTRKLGSALDALTQAIAAAEPAPAKTRGQVVAEDLVVVSRFDGIDYICIGRRGYRQGCTTSQHKTVNIHERAKQVREHIAAAIDAELAATKPAEPQAMQWISVKDAMPERKGEMVVWGHLHVDTIIPCAIGNGNPDWAEEKHLTHWISLPKYPRGSEPASPPAPAPDGDDWAWKTVTELVKQEDLHVYFRESDGNFIALLDVNRKDPAGGRIRVALRDALRLAAQRARREGLEAAAKYFDNFNCGREFFAPTVAEELRDLIDKEGDK